MIDPRKVLELVQNHAAWKLYMDRLHEDAKLDVYDYDLMMQAAEELAAGILNEIYEAAGSGLMRQLVIAEWEKEKEKTTAATVA